LAVIKRTRGARALQFQRQTSLTHPTVYNYLPVSWTPALPTSSRWAAGDLTRLSQRGRRSADYRLIRYLPSLGSGWFGCI